MLPTLQNAYADGTTQFKAGTAIALCEMADVIGKDYTSQKVVPILMELLKDDNSEVKLNVVKGLVKIAKPNDIPIDIAINNVFCLTQAKTQYTNINNQKPTK